MGKTIDELIENTKKNSIENALFNIVVKPDCEEELDKESLISPEIITGFTLNENSKTLRLIFTFYDKARVMNCDKKSSEQDSSLPKLPHYRLGEWKMKNLEIFDKIYDNCQIEIQYLSRYGDCVCSDIFHKCRFKSMDDLNDYFLCNSKNKIITFEYKRKDIQWNEFLLLDVNGVTKDEIDTSQKV